MSTAPTTYKQVLEILEKYKKRKTKKQLNVSAGTPVITVTGTNVSTTQADQTDTSDQSIHPQHYFPEPQD